MIADPAEHYLLYVTAATPAEARTLARQLVTERLAACTNVYAPVQSFYWWEGEVQAAAETVFVAKTRGDLVPAAIARVRQLHSYQVPAVLALPVADGNPDYLAWVDAACLADPPQVEKPPQQEQT